MPPTGPQYPQSPQNPAMRQGQPPPMARPPQQGQPQQQRPPQQPAPMLDHQNAIRELNDLVERLNLDGDEHIVAAIDYTMTMLRIASVTVRATFPELHHGHPAYHTMVLGARDLLVQHLGADTGEEPPGFGNAPDPDGPPGSFAIDVPDPDNTPR